eukprot:2056664-Rhodomonas_salina.1
MFAVVKCPKAAAPCGGELFEASWLESWLWLERAASGGKRGRARRGAGTLEMAGISVGVPREATAEDLWRSSWR